MIPGTRESSIASPVPLTNWARFDVRQALANLAAYLHSWETSEGLAGVIATWWSSTVDTAEPHPMNQAPTIQALVRLHERGVGGDWDWLSWAQAEGDALIRQIEDNGLLRNGWGDIPGRPRSPVIGFAAAGALYVLSGACQKEHYLDAADRILMGYEAQSARGDTLSHGVANQAARWAMTRLQRYLLVGEKQDLNKALRVGFAILPELITDGDFRGGMYQGRNSDILISVYVGKCLYPLLSLYQVSGESAFLDAARLIATYMNKARTKKEGLFVSAAEPQGAFYKAIQKMAAIDRRFLKGGLKLHKWRRQMISDWKVSEYPMFVARAADSIRGLAALNTFDEATKPLTAELIQTLLSYQQPHGGFPNTIGYLGSNESVAWQDVVAPTRWNSYVFQLLADLAVSSQGLNLPSPKVTWPVVHAVGSERDQQLVETEDKLSLLLAGAKPANIKWKINKSTGKTSNEPAWRGELTGARTFKQMMIERKLSNKSNE